MSLEWFKPKKVGATQYPILRSHVEYAVKRGEQGATMQMVFDELTALDSVQKTGCPPYTGNYEVWKKRLPRIINDNLPCDDEKVTESSNAGSNVDPTILDTDAGINDVIKQIVLDKHTSDASKIAGIKMLIERTSGKSDNDVPPGVTPRRRATDRTDPANPNNLVVDQQTILDMILMLRADLTNGIADLVTEALCKDELIDICNRSLRLIREKEAAEQETAREIAGVAAPGVGAFTPDDDLDDADDTDRYQVIEPTQEQTRYCCGCEKEVPLSGWFPHRLKQYEKSLPNDWHSWCKNCFQKKQRQERRGL